jgi:hypothetical protein
MLCRSMPWNEVYDRVTLFGISKSKRKCPLIGIDGGGFEMAKNHLGFSFAFTSLD